LIYVYAIDIIRVIFHLKHLL